MKTISPPGAWSAYGARLGDCHKISTSQTVNIFICCHRLFLLFLFENFLKQDRSCTYRCNIFHFDECSVRTQKMVLFGVTAVFNHFSIWTSVVGGNGLVSTRSIILYQMNNLTIHDLVYHLSFSWGSPLGRVECWCLIQLFLWPDE